MRIAVDARELADRPTGVGRYLAALLGAWSTSDATHRHEFVLYAHRPAVLAPDAWRSSVRLLAGAGGTAWEQRDLARAIARDRPDVLFAPAYTAPLLTRTPFVVTVHDVSFFAHPEWFSWREGLRRRRVTAWSARRARIVLAPSAFSASEIVRFTGVDETRVRVVHSGVQPPPAPPAEARAPAVLYVGTLFQRRRLDVLIDAFQAVAARVPTARLDLVGANRTQPFVDFAALVAARGLDGRVRVHDWVDDAALERLYGEAAVFVFLSRYEGFGFTPLEAMARGAVPVVLDTPVAREIYGDAAWRVGDGPALTADVADAVTRLLDDPDARARFRAAAAPLLAGYRWDAAAARVLACLEEAGRG
ncbi:MAG: glycosyltransferase family 4 protein [Vicinamibacterales bacterium]